MGAHYPLFLHHEHEKRKQMDKVEKRHEALPLPQKEESRAQGFVGICNLGSLTETSIKIVKLAKHVVLLAFSDETIQSFVDYILQ